MPIAQARITHVFESVIREVPAEGPGGKFVQAPGPLEQFNSMTVHGGDLYVAEHLEGEGIAGNYARTDQWTSSLSEPGKYEFVSQLPPQSQPTQARYAGVAFGTSSVEPPMYLGQSIFLPSGTITGVDLFATGSCGTLECATPEAFWAGAEVPEAPTPFGYVTGVAVDHSKSAGDWAEGDVFVADDVSVEFGGNGAIDIFEPQAAGEEKYVARVSGPEPGQIFEGAVSLAVSGFNGDLLVSNADTLYVMRPKEEDAKVGKYVLAHQITLAGLGAIAVDDGNGEIYAVSEHAISQFDSEGTFLGAITRVPREGLPGGTVGQGEEVPFPTTPTSLAVDPESHRVFAGLGNGTAVVDVLSQDTVVPDVVTEAPTNLALESDPETAVNSWRIEPTGSVNPLEAGAASCGFAWGLTEAFGQEAPCPEQEPVGNGSSPVPVHATLTGLEPDTAYVYRLQAKNEHGTNRGEPSQDYRFTTPGPGLRSESVSEVSSTGASFEATIAPHDAPVEEHDLQAVTNSPTSYFFQYSTQPTAVCAAEPAACKSVPSARASAGSGATDVQVSQHASGLTANTTYHYRLVAMNEALPATKPGVLVPFYGPDRTFTTQGPGGSVTLPDGRAWEMVSPADKHGARILPSGQASVDGSTFTFLTDTPTEPEPPGAGINGIQVLASRAAAGQWSSVDINLSRSQPEGALATEEHEYRLFSEDLGLGVVESEGPFSIPEGSRQNERGEWERVVEASPVPIERTPYLRRNSTCASAPSKCYEPLLDGEDVTSKEEHEGSSPAEGAANIAAATPDASHVIINSSVPLTAPGPAWGPSTRGLYDWSAASPPAERLSLVNVLEDGEVGPSATSALSHDGSRVFFTSCSISGGSIVCGSFYVRDVLRGETARLDVTEGGSPPAHGEGAFEGTNADGSKAFFTDDGRLTKNAGVNGHDLYVCDLGPEGVHVPKCDLTDLTPVPGAGQPGTGEDAQVSHALGVSADGSYVYFLAMGVQAPGATPGENLYVAHAQEGKWVTSFIASPSGLGENHCTARGCVTALSPDGRWLAFATTKPLTDYDNRDARTGVPDSEIYLYDAATGKLVCGSCNPSGARPAGPSFVPRSFHEPAIKHAERPLHESGSRSLFDNGRLFFDSEDALVPQDTNGNFDVYEVEPAGVDGCTAEDPTFTPATGACVGLISSGRASGESAFVEASSNASDVFFSTAERLVAKDADTAVDIYDAHQCSSASPCASEASAQEECASAATCRAAPVPQPSIFGPPSSGTFAGPGNLTPVPSAKPKSPAQIRAEKLSKARASCRHRYKRQRKRRVSCEKRANKAYGAAKKSKKTEKSAHANRGIGR